MLLGALCLGFLFGLRLGFGFWVWRLGFGGRDGRADRPMSIHLTYTLYCGYTPYTFFLPWIETFHAALLRLYYQPAGQNLNR
jgi:hypothetical protein